jgi:uncharacterized membrane protein
LKEKFPFLLKLCSSKAVGFNFTGFVDYIQYNCVNCFFSVSSLIGAITGSLIGLATESGMFRGAGIGAISGAVFSIEVVDSSRDLWNSNDSGVWSILYMVFSVSIDHFHSIRSNN